MENYPTDDQLEKIEKWPYKDLHGLMDYVFNLWEYSDWGFKKKANHYRLATGGWSGNEDIIGALHRNFIFWSLCWESSHRGGLHIFKIPKIKKDTSHVNSHETN